jgi:uncharacterized membrane protein
LTLAGVCEFVSRHALLLIIAVGGAIRFATLGSQGFWLDEHIQINTLSPPASELLATIMNSETQPPFYLVIGKLWQAVFGLGEVGLRSLSALAGTATIPLVYAAGRELGSRRAGLYAAALTATSPFMIWYSQEARPYALFAFLATLAFLFFVQALQGRGVRWLWGWAIVSILVLSTHYFGFLITGIEAVWLLWRLRGARVDVVLSIGAIGAASVPLVLLGLAQQHYTVWIEFLETGDRLAQVPQNLLVGLATPIDVLPPLVVGFVVAVALYAVVKSEPGSLRVAAVPAGVGLIGVAVTVIASIAGSDYLVTRNLIGFWAPLAITLGALLAAPSAKRVGAAAVAVMCVMGLSLAIWQASTPSAGRPDWEPLAAALGPAEAPRAIEYPSPFAVPLIHDLPNAYELVQGEAPTVEEIDVIEFRPVENHSIGPCWWQGVCGGDQVVGTPGGLFLPIPRDYELVDESQTELFTYSRYRGPALELPPAGTFENRVIVQTPP